LLRAVDLHIAIALWAELSSPYHYCMKNCGFFKTVISTFFAKTVLEPFSDRSENSGMVVELSQDRYSLINRLKNPTSSYSS
jgi:hypothetical protein